MKYLLEFCNKFDYPQNAVDELLKADKIILENEKVFGVFSLYVSKYENDIPFDHYKALDEIEKASENIGVHPYTVKFLFYLRLSVKLKSIYEKRNISDEIYYNTMLDLNL